MAQLDMQGGRESTRNSDAIHNKRKERNELVNETLKAAYKENTQKYDRIIKKERQSVTNP